ncbi:Pyruvate dehydrogenase E1 component subunit alpha [Candidatus Hepatincolaceae symbiont of Richtersius coronifer]
MSSSKLKFTAEQAKKIYFEMLLTRRFEEKCAQLYGMGYIAGFLHLYMGQEAIAAGFNHLKQKQDSHITSYRCHAHALLQGELDPKQVMSELTGKGIGSSKGKGGSMHIYSKKNNFFGGNGIVGAQVPLGAGLAFAHKYNKDNGVCFAYMGDGALPQGQVYEAFNMASLWKLPALFIIENNQYSMGTSLERTHANTDLSIRGTVFNIPGEKIDGMNILEVIEKGKKALDHVRSGKGPYLLEILTYRFRGHSMSDPQKYRTKEEVADIREKRDPITHFEHYVIDNKTLKAADIAEINEKVKLIIKEVEEAATTSKEPEASELWTDVVL